MPIASIPRIRFFLTASNVAVTVPAVGWLQAAIAASTIRVVRFTTGLMMIPAASKATLISASTFISTNDAAASLTISACGLAFVLSTGEQEVIPTAQGFGLPFTFPAFTVTPGTTPCLTLSALSTVIPTRSFYQNETTGSGTLNQSVGVSLSILISNTDAVNPHNLLVNGEVQWQVDSQSQ